MPKIFKISGAITVIVLIVVVMIIKFEPFQQTAHFSNLEYGFHKSGFFEMKESIIENFKSISNIENKGYWTQIGITSHHLPTALPFIAAFYKTLLACQGPKDTFVVIGPDHFERCFASASVTKKPYLTPFGKLYPDEQIIDELLKAGAYTDDQCFDGEHSIGAQTIFLKYLFPNAKIVPLIFSATTEDRLINNIVNVLAEYKDRITVIASVDFSHYQSYNRAVQLDQDSEQMIKDLSGLSFDLERVDSPASVKLAILLAKKIDSQDPIILKRANSYDFTGQSENTTGYMNAIFVDYKKTNNLATLMFVGDIMLSRSVGDKMERIKDWRWPFLKIANYLKKADLLFGNLESPISSRGTNVGSIYSFRANPKVIEGLKYAGFDVLSVANNHIGDWSRIAMEDTFRILKENNINYAGGGFSEREAHNPVIKEVKGIKFAFLAYTSLGARYTEAKGEKSGIAWIDVERMKQDIQEARKKSDFVVVSIHFGEEYQKEPNAFQKTIAHTAIDAGASLVIGHHPHVIQEIEECNGAYIAYSLGNFIFDQTFSKETREGLLLKITAKDKEIVEIEPVRISISKDFQASLSDK